MFNKSLCKCVPYLCIALVFTLFGYYLHVFIEVDNIQPDNNDVASIQPCPKQYAPIHVASNSPQVTKKITKKKTLAPYKQQIIAHTINNADDSDLTDKLSALFPNSNINENIHDIRQFSHRLLEEIGDSDTVTHDDSFATISFSLSRDESDIGAYSFDVSDKQTIFAHININGGLGLNNEQFFIKWRNTDTNEILLFTPKSMNPNSELNWVSLTPEKAWGNQNYEVSFYEYTSELHKLASATYTTFSQ